MRTDGGYRKGPPREHIRYTSRMGCGPGAIRDSRIGVPWVGTHEGSNLEVQIPRIQGLGPHFGGPEELDAGIWAMAGYALAVHNRQWRSKGIYGVRPEWEYAGRPKMQVLWGGTHECQIGWSESEIQITRS